MDVTDNVAEGIAMPPGTGSSGQRLPDTRIRVEIDRHEFRTTGGGTLEALRDLRIDVEPHTFVSLLGPSGCGKTTLLRMLGGLILPTDGAVAINDDILTGPPPQTSMVFQDHNLLPWRRALENVEFGLEIAGVPREQRRERARQALRLVGLEAFEQAYPHQLSGGMRQRVGLARALSLDLPIILMDEPFGALDAQTRETMQDQLVEIWEQLRATVVFVTHSIEEAVYLSDRVIVMTAGPGRVKADVSIDLPRPRGSSLDVKTSPEASRHMRELGALLRPEVQAASQV